MGATSDIFRKLIGYAIAQVGGSYDAVVRFDGNPFSAAEQVLDRDGKAAVLCIGLRADPASLKAGSAQTVMSALSIDAIVLTAFLGGREAYEESCYRLDDLTDAARDALDDGPAVRAALSGTMARGSSAGDIQVLVDEDGNYAARTIPLQVSVQRINT